MTLALTGTGLSRGVALGRVHKLVANELEIQEYQVVEAEIDQEIQRFRSALEQTRSHLQQLADQLKDSAGRGAEEIINTHLHMLNDQVLVEDTEAHISQDRCNAEWALQLQLDAIIAEFKNLDDEYIRSREEDVIQVVRLLQQTLSSEKMPQGENIPKRLDNVIIVAEQLAPNELAQLHDRQLGGLVTEHGSPHSHTAILARSLKIPALLGVPMAQRLLHENEPVVLDGHYGVLLASGDEQLRRHYHEKQRDNQRFQQNLARYRKQACVSKDGKPVMLLANAEREQDIRQSLEAGAEGVGLFRTEYLYVHPEPPDETEQLRQFETALKLLNGLPLTIRTLDLGADKPGGLAALKQSYAGPNPALGLRALRLCLRNPDLFKPQLRAILRASALGQVELMLPMLTRLDEVRWVHRLLQECRQELDAEGLDYDPELAVGGMIEVPAAAMTMDSFAKSLDFVSVGTNDLIQYLLAVDRVNEHVSHLYDPLHPAVLNLLGNIIHTARQHQIPVTLCGELAGDPIYTRLLLALGLRRFSMHPGTLLEVKRTILGTDVSEVRGRLDEMLSRTEPLRPGECLQQLNSN